MLAAVRALGDPRTGQTYRKRCISWCRRCRITRERGGLQDTGPHFIIIVIAEDGHRSCSANSVTRFTPFKTISSFSEAARATECVEHAQHPACNALQRCGCRFTDRPPSPVCHELSTPMKRGHMLSVILGFRPSERRHASHDLHVQSTHALREMMSSSVWGLSLMALSDALLAPDSSVQAQ